MRTVRTVIILLCLFLIPVCALAGQGWTARLDEHPAAPSHFVAVDKAKQSIFLLERKSPLRIVASYPCTTGQAVGDKQYEGDLKTPEGVYFVKRHINGGLDWDLYGGKAYTLNYPNPVDRLRRKTGHGIWVHGRGHEITPRETQGCVALNNSDLDILGQTLQPGTPVVLAENVTHPAQWTTEEQKIAAALKELSSQWTAAWQDRSDEFFSFYDPEAYTLANSGSFEGFRATKRRLFDRFDFIITWPREIHVLQGPDYWVTWFEQYYRAPNMSVEGIRRLYWQKDDAGELKIVGMEWQPVRNDLENAWIAAHKQDVIGFIKQWRDAWQNARLSNYMGYFAKGAQQGERSGLDEIRNHKQDIWSEARPETIVLDDFELSLTSEGLQVAMTQQYTDSSEYSDYGVKTLLLHPDGDSWKIIREDWRRITP